MEGTVPKVIEQQWADRLLDQMFQLWIEPAIEARGLDLSRSQVVKAVVVMPPDRPIEVRLNEEVSLLARVTAQRAIEAGEALTADDLSDIQYLEPADIDPNAGWFAFASIGGVITLAFDFRRNRETASELIARAGEFLAVARHAFTNGYQGPAAENGFAAAELAVKAQMYLLLDEPSRDHRERSRWWDKWVSLGNAPNHLQPLLSRLWTERPRSRYGDGHVTMSEADVGLALDHVAELIEHGRNRCAATIEWPNYDC